MGDSHVRRKGAGSKQKGSAFERECCRLLSRWLTNGLQDDVLWRSAVSGGRATVAAARGKKLSNQVGDISPISPVAATFNDLFMSECKHYQNLNVHGLIEGTGHLADFWYEACNRAIEFDKEPLLIAKQNHRKTIICSTPKGMILLNMPKQFIALVCPGDSRRTMQIVLFADFLNHAKPPGIISDVAAHIGPAS